MGTRPHDRGLPYLMFGVTMSDGVPKPIDAAHKQYDGIRVGVDVLERPLVRLMMGAARGQEQQWP